MSVPAWFNESFYLGSKLAQLKDAGVTEYADAAAVKTAIEDAGMTVFEHYQQFSSTEGTNPNEYFNSEYYLTAKAAQLNAIKFDGKTDWTAASTKTALDVAGMSALDHFLMYGWKEDVNPSKGFDVSDYLADKTDQMNADAVDGKTDWTVAEVKEKFAEAGIDPLSHYFTYGKDEGITPTVVTDPVDPNSPDVDGETFRLTLDVDTLEGTTGNDIFKASVDALDDGDFIDGKGGYDSLYAKVEARGFSGDIIAPELENVEKVLFRAQTAHNATGHNLTRAFLDAQDIQTDKTLTIGSDNSRATLEIEDVRHFSNDTHVRFSNTDPGLVDFTLTFDSQHLKAADTTTSGIMNIKLMDVKNAQLTDEPLLDNPFDTFTFNFTHAGQSELIKLDMSNDKAKVTGAAATYETLLEAFQDALKVYEGVHPENAGIFTIELGPKFTGTTTVDSTTYTDPDGYVIILKSNNGGVDVDVPKTGWGVKDGTVPAKGALIWDAQGAESTDCPLIETTIELDNVGRVLWEDATPNCLPDDVIYGSNAGDMVVGSMASRGGVERFDVVVDRGSWLSSLRSTNEALRMITVKGGDLDGDKLAGSKDHNGQLYIGDWEGNGDQLGSADKISWADAAKLLTATEKAGPISGSGLIDVAIFDTAAEYTGDINIAAKLTDKSFDKYLKSVDGVRPIDKMFAPNGGYEGDFVYRTAEGNDVINMTLNGAIAADNDFALKIDTGAGKDLVAFRFDTSSPTTTTATQSDVQQQLKNVEISTGHGDDTVWFFGNDLAAGGTGTNEASVIINGGNGNDTIYANQIEDYTGGVSRDNMPLAGAYNTIFTFNASDDKVAANNTFGATLQNDMAHMVDKLTLTAATAGDRLFATVTFRGVTAEAEITSITAGMTDITAKQYNQAIIKAITEDAQLSKLLVAKDGAGHTLLIESLINGTHGAGSLVLGQNVYKADGSAGTTQITAADLTTNYVTDFATDTAAVDYAGVGLAATTQVHVNPGASDDVIVLGGAVGLEDDVILGNEIGKDLIVDFQTTVDRLVIDTAAFGIKATTAAGTVSAMTDTEQVSFQGAAVADPADLAAIATTLGSFASGVTHGVAIIQDNAASTSYIYELNDTGTVGGAVEAGDIRLLGSVTTAADGTGAVVNVVAGDIAFA